MPPLSSILVAARRPSELVADTGGGRRCRQAGIRAALGEAVGVQVHPGKAGIGLRRHRLEHESVADFGEHLRGAAVIIRARPLREAGIGDGPVGIDLVERIAGAEAQVPRAGTGAGVERQQQAVGLDELATASTSAFDWE